MSTPRQKLLQIAEGYMSWANIHPPNAEELTKYVAGDVVLTLPYTKLTPDFAGLMVHHETAVKASPNFKLKILKAIADEEESSVVHYFECSGTHEG